jgi:hypothetical protein
VVTDERSSKEDMERREASYKLRLALIPVRLIEEVSFGLLPTCRYIQHSYMVFQKATLTGYYRTLLAGSALVRRIIN